MVKKTACKGNQDEGEVRLVWKSHRGEKEPLDNKETSHGRPKDER